MDIERILTLSLLMNMPTKNLLGVFFVHNVMSLCLILILYRNNMYGEVHVMNTKTIQGKLKEGNVFLINNSFVKLAKNMYKAVEATSMKITPWSKV